MLISEILLLAGLALLLRALPHLERALPRLERARARLAGMRGWAIFGVSALALFWLQPGLPVRGLGFWLPAATLALAALGWLLTAQAGQRTARETWVAAAALAGLVLLVGLTRYVGGGDWLVRVRPPAYGQVLTGIALAAAVLGGAGWWASRLEKQQRAGALIGGSVLLLIALLVTLKTPELALLAARGLRGLAGQNAELAAAADIRWLGFSYVCFRLIHTLRDRQAGRLPECGLRDYVTYVIFFPAIVAGPIDRLERFLPDLAAAPTDEADLGEAGRRLVIGLFKKFALADTLALVALNPTNALQVNGAGWLWLLLYAYALQIYFDFSGYTDIAIGIGRILGVRLPENFAAPYLKPNLTQFWNSWHMSLTFWFRAYYFNPVVRYLRSIRSPRWRRLLSAPTAVLLFTQVTTMLLIGLWHGVSWNFVLWGLWHGLGMFAQNRWTDFIRPRLAARPLSPWLGRALAVGGGLLTFHYVALGWVFFVLPDAGMAGQVLLRLFGGA